MSRETLGAAIAHHFMLRLRVYGHMLTIPKCHYALHLAGLLKEFAYLISTFTHERKHRVLKAFANNGHYVGKQERGLLQDCTCRELQRLENITSNTPDLDAYHKPKPKLVEALVEDGHCTDAATILVALVLYCNGRRVSNGDVALYKADHGTCCGLVHFHCIIDKRRLTCIAPWDIVERKDEEFICLVRDRAVLMDTACILESCVYSEGGPGELSHVLVPILYR